MVISRKIFGNLSEKRQQFFLVLESSKIQYFHQSYKFKITNRNKNYE